VIIRRYNLDFPILIVTPEVILPAREIANITYNGEERAKGSSLKNIYNTMIMSLPLLFR